MHAGFLSSLKVPGGLWPLLSSAVRNQYCVFQSYMSVGCVSVFSLMFYFLLTVLLKGTFSIKGMQEGFCNLGYISLWSHKTKVYCDLYNLPLILTSLKRLNCQRNRVHTPQRSIQPQQNIRIIKLRGWVRNEWEILIYLEYVEIKCQLDATHDFYCRSYCLLNMFRTPLCPSPGAREYYTGGCCLWYFVL